MIRKTKLKKFKNPRIPDTVLFNEPNILKYGKYLVQDKYDVYDLIDIYQSNKNDFDNGKNPNKLLNLIKPIIGGKELRKVDGIIWIDPGFIGGQVAIMHKNKKYVIVSYI